MAQNNKGNYNALTWVQDELQQSLALALGSMNKFIDEPANTTHLSDCVEAIYQVKGTLDMLNLKGASMLADECQQTTAALRDNKLDNAQAAQEAIIKALLLMPNYLKMLTEDFQDHPLSLLDNINELRQLRGVEAYEETALFQPPSNIILPERIAPNPMRKQPRINAEPQQLSHVYQLHLLNWLKQHDADRLQKMRHIAHFLRLTSHEEKTTFFWWSAETFLDALIHNGWDDTSYPTSLLGKLSQPIKVQTSHDEKSLLLAFPNELLNQLLLMIAKATAQTASVSLFKQTLDLNFYDHRQKIYGMSDNALSNAHHALLEQLQSITAKIEQYDGDHDQLDLLKSITEQLNSMSDTLALLEEYEASNLLHHQFETLEVIVSIEQPADEQTLTELADALLKVESLIKASNSVTVSDDLRSTVIKECLLEMSTLKETLTLASQNQQQHAHEFLDVAEQLTLISGSMDMLNYPEAANILDDSSRKIKDYANKQQVFNPAQLNLLAEILACCDLYMEGISQHGQALNNLLTEASEKLIDFDSVNETPATVEPEVETITPQEANDSSSEEHYAEGIDQEIADIFIEEAAEVLSDLNKLLPAWLHQNDETNLPDIRRHFHTLKGSGRMAGASVIGELAWAVEQVLNHVLQGTRPDTAQVKQLTSGAYQHIPELVNRFSHADLSSDETVVALTNLSEQCLADPAEIVEFDEFAPTPAPLEQETDDSTDNDLSVLEFETPELEITHVEEEPVELSLESEPSPSLEDNLTLRNDDLETISLEIPFIHDLDEEDLIIESDEPESSPEIENISSVERYIREHQLETHVINTVKPFTSVDRYILQANRQITSVDEYLQRKAATDDSSTLTDETAVVSTQPVTSVEQYIIERNQHASTEQAPVIEKTVRPFTSVDHYILYRNRPLTKVDLYIQARQAPTPIEESFEPELSIQDELSLAEDQELVQIFKSEARQHIVALLAEQAAVKLARHISTPALRSIHSLKGCANIAGITPMAVTATEMNAVFDKLHSQNVTLTDHELELIDKLIFGLDHILLSLDGLAVEPDIAELGAYLDELKQADDDEQEAPLVDPEFLVAYLEETDELLEKYTETLSHWFNDPNDESNNHNLKQTLSTLQEGAEQLSQAEIASIFISLSDLINESAPTDEGLKQLLEQGYEQLNLLIDNLIQNKPAQGDSSFPEDVQSFLSNAKTNADMEPTGTANDVGEVPQVQNIDETDFAIPDDADADILEAFSEEAAELLASSGQAIKDCIAGQETEQATQQLLRDLHTIKGGSRLAGIMPMADLAHHLETLLHKVSDKPAAQSEDFYDLLIRCQDKLTEMQEQMASAQAITTAISLMAEIEHFSADGTSSSVIEEPMAAPVDDAITSTALDVDETEFTIPQDTDPDLLEAFTDEAGELLGSSDEAIKQWLASIQTEEAIQQLQRDLHTIKGGARLTSILPLADLTHKLETLVNHVTTNPHLEDEEFFDLLQRCQDKLTEMQEQLRHKQPITTAVSLMAEIDFLIGEQASTDTLPSQQTAESNTQTLASTTIVNVTPETAETPKQTQPVPTHSHTEQVRVRADVLDDLSNYAGEISISRDRVTQQHIAMQAHLQEMEFTVTKLRDQLRQLEIETEAQILFRYEDEQLKKDQDFDPLELDRFSMMQQLSRSLSESVIDLLDISESMSTLSKDTDVLLLEQSRLNSDIQHGLMHTRLLPFATITPRMERIVRQTATELDKKTELHVSGADIELDRAILDRLVAPIEHILRNAIAHGIESSDQRVKAGKPETGSLLLKISREGPEMLLSIQDDGQGIDVEKIKHKALDLGLINESNIPSDDELVQLILNSGFSTADSVSQVAGRGVGMDVVSNEIRNLKGRLSIQTQLGQGTQFNIRLPLTLSVTQALLVSVQGQQYALPLGTVNAGERIRVGDIKSLLASDRPTYVFENEEYEFMPLASLLDLSLKLPEQDNLQLPLLLFRSGESRFAFLIDEVKGNREIVIKPLGKQLAHIRVLNGATILGDGRVIFILDIPTLTELAREKRLNQDHSAEELAHDLERIQHRPLTAMVVDDSITVRKATSNLLVRLGFEVSTAKDGVDALSQLQTSQPDIILLDVEMPRMDGFEFASMVRNNVEFRHLPIIMITSRTGEKHRERAKEIGVNAYLGKPFQEDLLVEHMKQLLGERFSQGNA